MNPPPVPEEPPQTHVFTLPDGWGCLVLRVEFSPKSIVAWLDRQKAHPRPPRRIRRIAERWIDRAVRPLKGDPRPMVLHTLTDGRLDWIGYEDGADKVFVSPITPR